MITLTLLAGLFSIACAAQSDNITQNWETISAEGEPTARHEAGLVAYKDKLLLMGGRRINPTDVFDTETNTWTAKSPTPIELHHFQPVVVDDAIYIVGAMTGGWPDEKPVERIIVYYPDRDEYVYGDTIPEHRRRGGAGAAVHNGKIYIVGGITNGHMNGYKPWLDEYDPKTGEWQVLEDAPNTRDHFQAVVADDKLYAFAGRRTSKRTDEDMALTNSHGNVYDLDSGKWETVTNNLEIPTQRAGNSAFAYKSEIIIGGGESTAHEAAHDEVEAFDTKAGTWRKWPPLQNGRHGTGFAVVGDYVYTASGSGNRGGGPELTSVERLQLPETSGSTASQNTKASANAGNEVDRKPVYSQWHTITLPFEGPETSEKAEKNPFLDYRLDVILTQGDAEFNLRGFYAADGNTAETGADSGNRWKVRFTPDRPGKWSYSARFQQGNRIALSDDPNAGEAIELENANGEFIVVPTDKDGRDFRAHGRLIASNGYFRFKDSGNYWMKGGANSPENLLAYADFDNTYRMQTSKEDGEAETNEVIHSYKPHIKDWKTGDPTWQDGKGKGLIGALNYLSSKGMNVAYFLTLNILGDGKDVWPYTDTEDFTRFDVSKLAQWEIVFRHMQSQGILLHMVLQETENERMLDDGDTGPMRQLYLRELVARFGHHLAMNFNLGEENGFAEFSPNSQNDAQRRAMTDFITKIDPYDHPILLHTHSHEPARGDILDSIVGFEPLDGLSLQANKRETAAQVMETWKNKAREAGHEWLITMDEIGKWDTGAKMDSLDPNHDSLRGQVLWGTLLSGAAGVEWYFGANSRYHDLNTEDWRSRDRLWELTSHAVDFFQKQLPFWEMRPEHGLIDSEKCYCFAKKGKVYALYQPDSEEYNIDLSDTDGNYSLHWYDPLKGGELRQGSVKSLMGGAVRALGLPPGGKANADGQDWMLLLKRSE